jgi:hypothetical protein
MGGLAGLGTAIVLMLQPPAAIMMHSVSQDLLGDQMAGSDAVVHAVYPIPLAEDVQQIDPGLKITGIRRMSGQFIGSLV